MGGMILYINERVNKLRQVMKGKGIAAYILPTSDPHQSEYVANHYKTRSWISGFTGSAGTVVITLNRALLWTDGRYFIQAEKELAGSEYELMRMGRPGILTYTDWLKANLNNGDTIAFDGKVFAEATVGKLENKLKNKGVKLFSEGDLIDKIWFDRPELPKSNSFIHRVEYTGLTGEMKLERVRDHMEKEGADYFLIASLDDIAWLYNIRGNDINNNPVVIAYGLVSRERAFLFVDKNKINSEVECFLNENGIELKQYEEVENFVRNLNDISTILLDKNRINRWLYSAIPKGCRILNQMDITTSLKAVKNQVEIENQKNAYVKDGVALVKFFHWLSENLATEEITEITAGQELEEFRKLGELFIEPSFDTISAYGANAAMAHYSASEEAYAVLKARGLYLVDSGGQYLDGTTDITRTLALGPISEEEKRDFTLTLKGHINLISAKFLKGTLGHQLDTICRYPLWQEGLDYKHGTGHGVGYFLNVHEGPHRIASVPNDVALEEGMVVSIEPGVYKENKHGIRIENIVVVEKDVETEFGKFLKFQVLSFVPIDLNCIDVSLLTESEKTWLNNYHKEVYDKLSIQLDDDERAWLKEATRSI